MKYGSILRILAKIRVLLTKEKRYYSPFFQRSVRTYKKKWTGPEFKFNRRDSFPITTEYNKFAGVVDGHYFLQDIYFAKIINQNSPKVHYDIGSRVDGFVAHLLSAQIIQKIVLIDIRPFPVQVDRLSFVQGNAMDLSQIENESIESLSSLHAIEHFGLGRYGDPIDPNGWKKGLKSIQAKISRGGSFYLALPVGNKNRLCFNAHRIFIPELIIQTLDKMELISFSYIQNYKIHSVPLEDMKNVSARLGKYDCGLFVFKKELHK